MVLIQAKHYLSVWGLTHGFLKGRLGTISISRQFSSTGVGISASRSQCCDIYRVLTYDFDDRTGLAVSQKTTLAMSEAVLSTPFS